MQCVLTKYCNHNEFLDLSQRLVSISVCVSCSFCGLIFYFVLLYSVLTIAQLLRTLVRSGVSALSSLSEPW